MCSWGENTIMNVEKAISTDDIDALFSCLSDSHRRTLLRILAEESTPLDVETLARLLVAHVEELGDEGRTYRDIIISLLHVHIPKMSDVGIITVDSETETIEEGPYFDFVRPYLQIAQQH